VPVNCRHNYEIQVTPEYQNIKTLYNLQSQEGIAKGCCFTHHLTPHPSHQHSTATHDQYPMSLTTILLSPPVDYKTTHQLSLPNKSIDHPNPSLSTYSHSAGPQVGCPRGVSPSFNNAECDTIAKADAGVKEFVPAVRRGDVHAIISKLKDIITQPDQTTVTVSPM